MVREQQSRRELFHSCSISQADQLTDCHVMEITDQVQNRSTSVSSACKQAMESGLQPRWVELGGDGWVGLVVLGGWVGGEKLSRSGPSV